MREHTINRRVVMKHVDVDTAKIGVWSILGFGMASAKFIVDHLSATVGFLILLGSAICMAFAVRKTLRSYARDRDAAILRHQCPRLDFKSVEFKRASFEQVTPLKKILSGFVEKWEFIRFIEDCGMDDGMYVYDLVYDDGGNRKKPRRKIIHFSAPLPIASFTLIDPPAPTSAEE